MDFKSILIGGLGTALLFVSIGAGTHEEKPTNKWQHVKVLGAPDVTEITSHTIYSFDILFATYNPDRINESTGEKLTDPLDHWEYTVETQHAFIAKD